MQTIQNMILTHRPLLVELSAHLRFTATFIVIKCFFFFRAISHNQVYLPESTSY